MEHFRKSLAIREALGDKAGIADTLNNIGRFTRRKVITHKRWIRRASAAIARSDRRKQILWEPLGHGRPSLPRT